MYNYYSRWTKYVKNGCQLRQYHISISKAENVRLCDTIPSAEPAAKLSLSGFMAMLMKGDEDMMVDW